MGLYSIFVKPFVHKADIEKASKKALRYFEFIEMVPLGRTLSRWVHNNRTLGLQREVFGLPFYNPVGLGSGLDIHGELYNDLNNLGFSFVEIGPMGADGVRRAVRHIQEDTPNDILGCCINRDFLTAFTLAYDFCDFFVIDLTDQSGTDILDPLLDARLAEDVYKPIVLKLPKEISATEINEILDFSLMNGIDGIEARNIEQVRQIAAYGGGNRLPIIANTHIESPEQAAEALQAGASLVEVRNGLVRQGPRFVSNILKFLLKKYAKNERTHPKTDSAPADPEPPDT
jgi:dihydroorotate dehydrogenase